MNETWIEGAISVAAAIESGHREVQVVYVSQGKWTRPLRQILDLAEARRIAVETVAPAVVSELAGGRTHGGIVARVGPRRFQPMSDLLRKDTDPFIVMLDGIEDPYNLGQAARALYAAGVHGLVLRRRDWLASAAVVVRASAGASEYLPVATVDDPGEAARFFRDKGLLIVVAERTGSSSIHDADLSGPLFMLIGGAKRGTKRSIRDEADLRVHLPYGRTFKHSLGVSTSAGILAFEILRQRRLKVEPRDSH